MRVTADVPCALEHDLQDVLDERQPAVEVHADREPGVGVECLRRAGHVPVGQGTHVAPDLVVLAIDAGLELGELREYFRGLAAAEQLAAGPEAQVDAGERLHVAVVQRPGDALALGRGLEVTDARFERQTLLAEVPDEVPGDGEIHGPHRVEIGAVGARHEDEAQIQRDARRRHGERPRQPAAEAGGEHREGEEHVGGAAVRALRDERDAAAEEDVAPGRDGRGARRSGQPAADDQVHRRAVGEVRQHHRERVRIERERSAGERQPPRERRRRGIDVHRDEAGDGEDHPAACDVALDLDLGTLSHHVRKQLVCPRG